MAGFWESALPGVLTAGAGVGLAEGMLQRGEDTAADLEALGREVRGDMQFKPFSVRTGLGTSTVGADGTTNLGVGGAAGKWGRGHYAAGMDQMAQAGGTNPFMNAAMDFTGRSLQDTAGREAEVFDRMMAAQQPGLDRARASMEARAHAQGRGGIAGSQYGGSGEQFAQSRAEAEARNQAMLGAMNFAGNEQMRQAQMAQGYGGLGLQDQMTQANIGAQRAGLGLQGFQSSFLPMQHQLQALQAAQQNANLAQTGQISGANMLAQLGLGGRQVDMNAQKAASELYGNLFGALAPAASTVGGILDEEGVGGLWDSIKGIFS